MGAIMLTVGIGLILGGCAGKDQGTDLTALAASEPITSVQGQTAPLQQLLGKEHLMVFYYTYGSPCLRTFPELQKVAAACTGVSAVGFEANNQPAEMAKQVIEQLGITFPLYITSQAEKAHAFDLYPVRGLPTTLFVNKDGYLQHTQTGILQENQIREILQEHLGVAASDCAS